MNELLRTPAAVFPNLPWSNLQSMSGPGTSSILDRATDETDMPLSGSGPVLRLSIDIGEQTRAFLVSSYLSVSRELTTPLISDALALIISDGL
ncbi:hypothetical protein PAXRUDRAFT_759210 [Paxillus rubicundulus Ve08.2h10]|uniref:Uncharacterized protein n=1 Tax=Paxillus rubicundulus Ve08.2h10 TaxID=930991 RepID=A0A0D0D0C2_9AGAM|nr:hypothetical protein PAXRUDRAFT_759210 [Paxillus rubicundulus Ve08.2h10]